MMSALADAIRQIRKRLDKTMVQFAELIGCKQSTVSRYESGKLVPGRSVLILLLQLARGAERQPVLDALGVTGKSPAGWGERQLATALRTFEDYLEVSGPVRPPGAPAASLTQFARAAKRIVLAGQPVDPALVSILQHWTTGHADPKALDCFRHIAAYLEVELKLLAARTKPRRKRARSR